mgnify:FL=1
MNYLKEQWRQDKLRCALAICWLVTVAVSFFNAYLFPIEIPRIGTWYAFRTMLPLTAILYVICAVREKRFFWKDSTALEKWCYVFIAVMLLYGAASLPRALDLSWTFRRLFNLCFDMCFFFLMLRLCRWKEIRKLTLVVCFIMWVAVMLMGIYEVFNGGIVEFKYNRANYQDFTWFLSRFQYPVVFFGNTNDYALLLTFFYAVFLLIAWREPRIPQWVTVVLTTATYFLLLATSSRLSIYAFFILLAAQILCSLLRRQKAARRTAATMLLCVFCIQFCNQYQFIVPPIEHYLHQRAEYTQAVKDAEEKTRQDAEDNVQQGGEASGEQQETPVDIEKPELQIGDPRKETLHDQFFATDDVTGEKMLRNDASAGERAQLLIHALRCFIGSYGLGVGFGNTEIMAREYANIAEGTLWNIHCFLARIIGDYGLFILIPLCAIAFLLLKNLIVSALAAQKRKDRRASTYALLFFAVLLTYPIVSTVSSDAQDNLPMWIYLALVVLLNLQYFDSRALPALCEREKDGLDI